MLVTGGSGLIGSRVLPRLVDAGAEVHGLARSPLRDDPAGNRVRWSVLDIDDGPALERHVRSLAPDVILHLAGLVMGARSRELVMPLVQTSLVATVHLLTAAADVRCSVVLAGSMEEPAPDEDADAVPRSPYAAAKWASSAYGRMFARLWELPVITLRPSMVYGPGPSDPRKLVPYTILSLLRGEAPGYASGRRAPDWIHVDDAAAAFVAAAGVATPAARTVDVGSGEMSSIRDVVMRLVALVDPSIEPRFGVRPDPSDEAERPADVETAARVLGWRAGIGLEEGLRDTVRWYRERAGAGALA